MTDNLKVYINALGQEIEPVTVKELTDRHPDKFAGKTDNSKRASLSSTSIKHIIIKTKKQENDKLVTAYQLVENWQELLNAEVEK